MFVVLHKKGVPDGGSRGIVLSVVLAGGDSLPKDTVSVCKENLSQGMLLDLETLFGEVARVWAEKSNTTAVDTVLHVELR